MKAVVVFCTILSTVSITIAQNPLSSRTDTQIEIELGRAAYEQVLQSPYRSKNQSYCNRVERIVSQLVAAMPKKLYAYQAVVIGTNVFNAECLPGGYITVYEKLIALLPDDNQLAFVLAHEIGHGARRHWARRTQNLQRDIFVNSVIAGLTQTEVNTQGIYLRSIAFSRDQESDADSFGTELYLRAGFDPDKITSAMRVMKSQEAMDAQDEPYYLRTHPLTQDRIQNIQHRCDELISGGLKPTPLGNDPDLSIAKVFGVIPTLATRDSIWQPTTTGSVWEYQVTSSSAVSSYSIRLSSSVQVRGTRISRMSIEIGGQKVSYQLIADGDHIWRRNRPEKEDSIWTVQTVLPEVGKSVDAGKWIFKSECLESVTIPLGTFTGCLKVVSTEESGRVLIEWFAPGVGLVKRENPKTGVIEILNRFSTN